MAWEVIEEYEVPHEPSEAAAWGFVLKNTETGETARVEVWEISQWGEPDHMLEVIWEGAVDYTDWFDPDDPADVERAKRELFERYPELEPYF